MFYIVTAGDHRSCGVFRTREEAEAVLEGRSYWFRDEEVITAEEREKRLQAAMLDIEYSFCRG